MEERVFDSIYDEILRLNDMMKRLAEEGEEEDPENPKIYISDLADVIESRQGEIVFQVCKMCSFKHIPVSDDNLRK